MPHKSRTTHENDPATTADDVLAIPRAGLERLREGAYAEIANAAEALQIAASTTETRNDGKTPYRPILARLRDACALLDAIEWSTTNTPTTTVQIDLYGHHQALTRALDLALAFAEDDLTDLDKHVPAHTTSSETAPHTRTIENTVAFREFATTAREQLDRFSASNPNIDR